MLRVLQEHRQHEAEAQLTHGHDHARDQTVAVGLEAEV